MSHEGVNQRTAATVLSDAVQKVISTQQEAIAAGAAILADSVGKGGVVQVFGTGHSRSFAMEIAGRAGGLVPANKIAITDLAFFGPKSIGEVMDPHLERDDTSPPSCSTSTTSSPRTCSSSAPTPGATDRPWSWPGWSPSAGTS